MYEGFTGRSVESQDNPKEVRRATALSERNSKGFESEYGELFLSVNWT
jgi:hypothetical protein